MEQQSAAGQQQAQQQLTYEKLLAVVLGLNKKIEVLTSGMQSLQQAAQVRTQPQAQLQNGLPVPAPVPSPPPQAPQQHVADERGDGPESKTADGETKRDAASVASDEAQATAAAASNEMSTLMQHHMVEDMVGMDSSLEVAGVVPDTGSVAVVSMEDPNLITNMNTGPAAVASATGGGPWESFGPEPLLLHETTAAEHFHEHANDGGSKLDPPAPPSENYAIFVSDIPRNVSAEQLKEAFSSIGAVYSAEVVKNRKTGEAKGFGFVHFYTMDDVYKALDWQERPSFFDASAGKMCECVGMLMQPNPTPRLEGATRPAVTS
eukprot:TRINITY_DN3967_c0_g1_i1.p3 TRINITY_DN3967_c0_g1~~TRINITY_DN3967_c0_g1_i1.p3  ORF type:complete len:331 (-),score=91.97 TRINITY_DN3967_c0_g1_i1:3095-4054(-)